MIKDNIKEFVESSVSNDFDLTVDEIAEKCKNYGRFKAWLNSDLTKIKRVLNIVKDEGMSPAFFASYERTEGYHEKWGWLNHTRPQGDYYDDAKSVANVVINQGNNMTANPSWIDYGNPVDFVPADVKKEGNNHFKSLKKGTIGRALIPLTAAATWEVYYPNGLKKEFNKVRTYGKPITLMVESIQAWGGNISGGGGGNGGTDPDPDPDPEPDPSFDIEHFLNELKKLFGINLYDLSDSFKGNDYFKVTKSFTNVFNLQATEKFYNEVKNIFGTMPTIPDPDPDPDPVPDPDPDPDPDGKPIVPMDLKDLWVTSEFGMRNSRPHNGIDLGVSGNPIDKRDVYATMSGTVTAFGGCNSYSSYGCNGGAGNYVIIDHDDGYSSRYLHLGQSLKVKTGDKVDQGQVIGKMANSGSSRGSHLHFEVSTVVPFNINSVINPRDYIDGLSKVPKT